MDLSDYGIPSSKHLQLRNFLFCFLNVSDKYKILLLNNHSNRRFMFLVHIFRKFSLLFYLNDFFFEQMKKVDELYLAECSYFN